MRTLHCAREQLTDGLIREIDTMLDDQYHSTVSKDGIPPYDFKWEQYRTLEHMGALIVTTARYSDRVLVGLALYVVSEHPHHQGFIVAECDSLATKVQYRGHGIARQLYQYTEAILQDAGVRKVVNRYRHVYKTKPLFEKLGFRPDETCYVKDLT